MRKVYFSLLMGFAWMALPSQAQQVSFGPLHSPDSPRENWILPGDTVYQDGKRMVYNGKPMEYKGLSSVYKQQSSVYNGQLKDKDGQPLVFDGQLKPCDNELDEKEKKTFYWGGLHPGLNLTVDLSAFATFGKLAPHRGGFTQTFDATYLTPLTKDSKLWMAIGGYITNTNYGGDSFHDGGVYGIVGYKFNEHWEAYAYGQLSISNNYNSFYGEYAPYGYGPYGYGMSPYGYGTMHRSMMGGVMPGGYGMGVPGANVYGVGVRYNTKGFSIGFNYEGVRYENKTPTYSRQHDYPVPEAPGKR